MKCFYMFSLVVKEPISESDTIDANITSIERRVLSETDEHSFLNKGNDTQVSENCNMTPKTTVCFVNIVHCGW